MNVLVIGGTIFLGRRIVEAALQRGHAVSLFSRGRHNPDPHPAVEKLRGDRNSDVSALRGRSWDAVIDTCGYVPLGVRLVAEAVRHGAAHYTFVSSISVYADMPAGGIDESGAVGYDAGREGARGGGDVGHGASHGGDVRGMVRSSESPL
jgi:2'-hydroxyisoflavone reductase